MKRMVKTIVNGFALAVVFLPALLCGFGRIGSFFNFFAQAFAMLPGLPGDFLRVAYYHLTLESCSLYSRISFGSFIAHQKTRIAPYVYIGAYSIIGRADIGDRCQIASHVQILAGKRQHDRDPASGRILPAEPGKFEITRIGADCWLGAACIVMADVGEGVTIGAGSVVTRPIPAWSVAVGSPARVISRNATSAAT